MSTPLEGHLHTQGNHQTTKAFYMRIGTAKYATLSPGDRDGEHTQMQEHNNRNKEKIYWGFT